MIRPPLDLVGDDLEYEVEDIIKCIKGVFGEMTMVSWENNHLGSGKRRGDDNAIYNPILILATLLFKNVECRALNWLQSIEISWKKYDK